MSNWFDILGIFLGSIGGLMSYWLIRGKDILDKAFPYKTIIITNALDKPMFFALFILIVGCVLFLVGTIMFIFHV